MEVILEGKRSYFRGFYILSGSYFRVLVFDTEVILEYLINNKLEAILEYMEVILEGNI